MLYFFLTLIGICLLNYSVAKDELLLVQALWRHGDRSPTGTFKNDPNQEEAWPQGWGQLSPKGMAQHVVLGRKLKARYIDQLKLLSERYLNKEIYIRSTDVNRTLTSAISNMIGFYSRGMPGKDYPSEKESQWWPHGFTPVAVHTIASYEDHIIPDIPEVPCARQSKIHEIILKTPEFHQLMEDNKQFFSDLSHLTGDQVNIFNFGLIADTLFIEDLYHDALPHPMPEWTQNRTLREKIRKMDILLDEWINGRGISAFESVHFDIELPRIRGGPILWIIIDNMQNKLKCASENVAEPVSRLKSPVGSPLCDWIRTRKYFAYSAHDTTIAALFSALGFNKTNFDVDGLYIHFKSKQTEKINLGESLLHVLCGEVILVIVIELISYPHYSSCVTFELWQNATNEKPYVKALYWPPDSDTYEEMTRNITGCETNSTLDRFAERSKIFKPVPSPDEYCNDTHFPANSSPPVDYFQNYYYILLACLLFAI